MRYDVLPKYISKFEICCLTETKTENIPTVAFPNFEIFSLKQKSKAHGISVLVKTGLFPTIFKIENTKSKCIIWIALGFSIEKIQLIVGGVYIPGPSSKYSDIHDYDIISEDIILLNQKYRCPFVLLGDFNSRIGNLNELSQNNNKENGTNIEQKRQSLDRKIDTHGRKLIALCNDFNFGVLNGRFGNDKNVGQFTCMKTIGSSVVDYIIVSISLFPSVLDFYVDKYDNCMSDVHLPLVATIKLENEFKKTNEDVGQKYETVKFKSFWESDKKKDFQNAFSNEKILALTEKLQNESFLNDFSQEKIDLISKELTNIIVEPAKHVGICKKYSKNVKRLRKSHNQSWFNESCEKYRSNYFKSKNSIWASKSEAEKNHCIARMKENGKIYKKFIAKVQLSHNKNFHKNLRKFKKLNPKDYWRLLKKEERIRKRETKVPLRVFEKHFEQLNQNNNENLDTPYPDVSDSFNQEINEDFTLDELKKNLKFLNSNKAAGLDLIKNEFLKNSPESVIKLAVILFNLVLKTGFVPLEWCIGLIIPIYKNKGSYCNPNNYRGITLLSCLGKFFTLSINIRLGKYMEPRGIIGEEQAAFREGYGTMDHIFVFNEIINLYICNKKKLYACFIDYEKAFDTIDRSALWGKLLENNINGNVFKVIFNMYKNAKSCVKNETMISGIFACNMGVRQGENLSPLLFSIFLNDFQETLSKKYNGLTEINTLSNVLSTDEMAFFINMFVLLYADDTLVLAESPNELQNAMDEVHSYCQKWSLRISTDKVKGKSKTRVVIFSKGKVKTEYNFKMGEKKIETDTDYCYLGVTFNFNGKFTKAIAGRISEARKSLFSLNSKAGRLQLPPDIHIDLFHKLVLPICMYGCEVWGYANLEKLEIFYRKFLKRVLCLNKSTPNCVVYGETGTVPISNLTNKRMISFWIKVSEGKQSKLSTSFYKLIYKLHLNDIYHSPWLMKIKNLLCSSGNPSFWFNQELFPSKIFMKNILSKQLEDQYVQGWNLEVAQNRKCNNYRIFKEKHCFEKYLLVELNFLERTALCHLRTGNHKLPISKQRYNNDDDVDVDCPLCEKNAICDEFHVIFECKFFDETRKTLLKKFYYNRPNTLKMSILFNTDSPKELKNLGKFAKIILSQFKT